MNDCFSRCFGEGPTQTSHLRISADCSSAWGSTNEPENHHIFRKPGVEERINLQRDGSHAKPYQVRQVRAVIVQYKLAGEE